MIRNHRASRSNNPIKTPVLSPTQSVQERGTGTGKKTVTIPSTASQQLRIAVNGDLKSALNNYDSITLPAVSNPGDLDPRYSKKSPSRTVGKAKL